jgi:hypothetical protein
VLAYDIWYRGTREYQRECPEISTCPIEQLQSRTITPKYIDYVDKIIDSITRYDIHIEVDAQPLDRGCNRIKVFKDNKWHDSRSGPRLLGIPPCHSIIEKLYITIMNQED